MLSGGMLSRGVSAEVTLGAARGEACVSSCRPVVARIVIAEERSIVKSRRW